MSDSNQDQDRSPRITRSLVGRIVAVSLFVGLGTFAVIHTMMGDGKTTEQQAKLEKGLGINGEKVPANSVPQLKNDDDKIAGGASPATTQTQTPPSAPPLKSDLTGFGGNSFGSKPNSSLPNQPSFSPSAPATNPASQPNNSLGSGKSFDPAAGFDSSKNSPMVTAKPPTEPPSSPPNRFAQLPDNGVPIIGNQSGFGTLPTAPPTGGLPATLNNALQNANDSARKLGGNVVESASDLIQGARQKSSETVNELRNSIPGIGNNPPITQGNPSQSGQPTLPNLTGQFPAAGQSPLPNQGGSQIQPPSMRAPTPTNNFSPLSPNGIPDSNTASSSRQNQPFNNSGSPPSAKSSVLSSANHPFGSQNPTNNNSAQPINSALPPIQSSQPQAAPPRDFSALPNQSRLGDPNPSDTTGRSQSPFNVPSRGQSPPATVSPFSENSSLPGNSPSLDKSPSANNSSSLGNQNKVPSFPASSASPSNRPTSRISMPNSLPTSGSSNNSAASAAMTSNLPGDRQLEGVQSPSLTIEKLSPREIQLNQSADFQIVVRNVGRVTAEDVNVTDQIPAGTEFQGSLPEPTDLTSDRRIRWDIGELRPGQEKRIKLQLKPTETGEIGSVAHVTFATPASMRTLVTKPVLEITHRTNPQVMIGDDVILDVIVQNKGDGPANNVIIQEDVPKQLEYQAGYKELEYEVGTLLPGQSKRIQLGLKAVEVGRLKNIVFASAAGGLKVQHDLDMEVIAPNLVTSSDGPTRRFLQREVTHNFRVANKGTAKATNVDLIARLPAGLRFVNADNRGRYDANSHAVYWSLAELGLDVDAGVQMTSMPVEVGTQDINFEARADLNQKSATLQNLSVEHLVDVFFDIDDVVDPIEIGSATSYKIRIINQGTQTAANVLLQIDFPNGILPTSVEGNLQNQIQGQRIAFAPISSLNSGEQIQFIVNAKGQLAGDHRVVVNMQADGRQTPVSKEETTRVYADR